jgi:hypothetical protein
MLRSMLATMVLRRAEYVGPCAAAHPSARVTA